MFQNNKIFAVCNLSGGLITYVNVYPCPVNSGSELPSTNSSTFPQADHVKSILQDSPLKDLLLTKHNMQFVSGTVIYHAPNHLSCR